MSLRIKLRGLVIAACMLPGMVSAQYESLTVMTYNMLNFPSNSSTRIEHFKTVIREIAPDILVTQEIVSDEGVTIILNDILRSFSLDYEAGAFFDEGSQNNAVFYRRDRVALDTVIALNTDLRDINGYVFSIHDHADSTFSWTLFSTHLKASSGPSNARRRWLEVAKLQQYISAQDSNYHYGFAGDFNVYDEDEPGYTLLMDSMSVDLVDPIDTRAEWHNNSAYAGVHTQSTRLGNESDGGASGGLDDRFDFILLSHQLIGRDYPLTYVEGSYEAYGNDGQHFNKNINDAPEYQGIPRGMADALYAASDHLPVFLRLAYPGTGNTIAVKAMQPLPERYALRQNYPNPFNPVTTITYEIPIAASVDLRIYDLAGREVMVLAEGQQSAGLHGATWHGRDYLGRPVPSGIYIARLQSAQFSRTIKMVLLK